MTKPGFLEVLQLGMRDLAVHLRQSLLAAHGQYGVAEADEQDDEGQVGRSRLPIRSHPNDSLFSGTMPGGKGLGGR